ncbi:MAG: peptidoglycan-binding domain-containing protein, partial [Gammaproteobacteria bacterium]
MSNRVELLYRINQGQTETVPAKWVQNDSSGKAQYFRARLPAFRAGDVVEYVPVCRCAGRQVPAANDIQAFTSSFRVAEAGADLIRTRATRATSSSARSARTRGSSGKAAISDGATLRSAGTAPHTRRRPITSPLHLLEHSEEVAGLHSALTFLKFDVDEREIKKKMFGRTARKAVRAFQAQHGLSATGRVDPQTADRFNQVLRSEGYFPGQLGPFRDRA